MANKKLAAVSICCYIVGFVLTLSSFYIENWVFFETSEEERQFGLFRQTDGFDPGTIASWYWQSVFYCEAADVYSGEEALENVAKVWCDIGTRFRQSGLIYYVCYLLAFIFLMKQFICLISILQDRDPGDKKSMIGYSLFYLILSVVAFSCWWGINDNVKYDANWETDDFIEDSEAGEVFELCAGPGATLNIIAFISNFLAGVMGIVCAINQDDLNVIKVVQTAKIGCLTIKRHFLVIYFLSVMSIALSLTTPLIRTWVQFNITNTQFGRDDDYTGSLFSLDQFTSNYAGKIFQMKHFAWDCIAGASCEVNFDGFLCKTFDPLAEAGRIYFNIQLTVSGLLLLWHNFFGYWLLFSREWGHPKLTRALPHAAWILHLVAVVCWAVVSEVKFEVGDCENKNTNPDEQLDVWINRGPLLAILQLVLQVVSAVYFNLIYRLRGKTGLSDIVYDWPESKQIKSDLDSTFFEMRAKQLLTDPKRQQLLPLTFPTVSAILIVEDANAAVSLYLQAFSGDVEDYIENSGRIYYAEIKIGVSYIIIKDINAQKKFTSPKHLASTTGEVYIEFVNCDLLYHKCKSLGFSDKFQVCKENAPSECHENQKYRIECPFGHIFTFIEKQPMFRLTYLPQIKCIPYIIVSDALKSIELYTKVFNAEISEEETENQGKIVPIAMKIGTSILYLGEQGSQVDIKSPQSLGNNTSIEVMIAIIEHEEQYNRCIEYGFKSIQKPYNTPWGNQYAKVEDPFGHIWNLQLKDDILDEDNISLGWSWKKS